ncbi:MAG: DUF3127 domain-containing protein [Verrucomicrobia bacterium]|nr:DUF3127 domain-containing protein [Verrucomicrobiota bacterium]
MAAYELTGTVKVVMDEVTFDSGFNKREFVVSTDDDRYPQDIKFECVKDKAALLEGVNPGQRVTVTFDIRGNEYKGRYFVSLTAWRLSKESVAAEVGSASGGDGPPLDQLTPPVDEDPDNLPF